MASSCNKCGLMKNYYGSLPFKCKCDPEEEVSPFSLMNNALVALNSNSVMPRNGAMTRTHRDLERGIQTYQRVVMRNGRAVETEEYRSLNHSNVVKLLAEPWLDSQGMWNIPLELISGKTLEKLMFSPQSNMELTKPIMITIIKGMCEGLTYMHSKNIVHQDLKPDNIMVEYNTYRAVIIDLGLARFQKNGFCFGVEGGNLCYSAPEIFQGKYRDQYSDVWAMGKIIAELLIVPRARLPPTISTVYVFGAMGMNPYGFPISRMVDRRGIMRTVSSEVETRMVFVQVQILQRLSDNSPCLFFSVPLSVTALHAQRRGLSEPDGVEHRFAWPLSAQTSLCPVRLVRFGTGEGAGLWEGLAQRGD
ncbi:hypothetical protein QQF64_009273 [Cirrhinus molitorella]|uniref:Protein kinase domain-containing protein n=1 Tax=Cirrhinus molitorella TaxID=172907 RepID=A0ABR3M0Q3_9TELE